MTQSVDHRLLLQQFHARVRQHPNRVYLTQPIGGGQVKDYTWAQVSEEARRMAAHLQSLGYPPGSCIAMITKNCAHFIIAELAIWMAGYTSVALFPTFNAENIKFILAHSEAKLIFIGKLDSMADVDAGTPADLPRIVFPLAPKSPGESWDAITARTEPLAGEPVRGADELSIIIYTSGSTGQPKGVMHSFRTIALGAETFVEVIKLGSDERILSYLPLAHAFERAVVEATSFIAGFQIYFAESLETFISDIKRARPTVFISVPRLWLKFQLGVFAKQPQKKLDLLLKIPPERLARMRSSIEKMERMSPESRRDFAAKLAKYERATTEERHKIMKEMRERGGFGSRVLEHHFKMLTPEEAKVERARIQALTPEQRMEFIRKLAEQYGPEFAKDKDKAKAGETKEGEKKRRKLAEGEASAAPAPLVPSKQ